MGQGRFSDWLIIINQCFNLAPNSLNKHRVILFGRQRSASLPIRALSMTIFSCMLSDGNYGAPKTRLEILRKNSVARLLRAHQKAIEPIIHVGRKDDECTSIYALH